MPAASPIHKVFAYTVEPASSVAPTGGAVKISADVQAALKDAYAKANLDAALPVSFVFDPQRNNEVRSLLMQIAFERGAQATTAGGRVAKRLSDLMDRRSKPCLLVISVGGKKDAKRQQLVVWLFPKDEGFQMTPGSLVLSDIFSRTSGLRKAAMFQGVKSAASFMGGRVLDYQANASDRFLADFWLVDFLAAQLQMTSHEGTKLFATTLKITNDALENGADKDQLYAAIGAIRTNPKQRWSLNEVADTFLSGRTKTIFLESAPNRDSRQAFFQLDIDRLDKLVQFRIFSLEGGTTVSAPFVAIGETVRVSEQQGRRVIEVSGTVVDEKLRARGGA